MAIEVDILGSVVCRDILRHDEKRHYQVKRCISEIPISTLYQEAIKIPKEKLENWSLSPYQRQMLELQGTRKAVEVLKESKAEVLIMDLADELSSRFVITSGKREIGLAADEKFADDIKELFATKGKKLTITQKSPLEMNLMEIEESYRAFAKDILKTEENPEGYQESHIVVIEAYYTEGIIDNATAKWHNHSSDIDVKKMNERLGQLYQMLYRYIPECQVIRFPSFMYSSENHIRGTTPLSYTEDAYRYYLKVLDILFGYNKTNSIENIYNEQSLSNKLYARMLNATVLYSIEGMKKDIRSLKEENKKLKKEIASFRKGKS